MMYNVVGLNYLHPSLHILTSRMRGAVCINSLSPKPSATLCIRSGSRGGSRYSVLNRIFQKTYHLFARIAPRRPPAVGKRRGKVSPLSVTCGYCLGQAVTHIFTQQVGKCEFAILSWGKYILKPLLSLHSYTFRSN